jgi:mono/diheme cytochrome c family protein
VPYHDVKVTEPAKLERMTDAYQAFLRGELDRSELPDIRDVFPDDPVRLAEMGMATEPGLQGEAVLIQACSQCHNDKLDPSLSRARFRANLQGMSRAEKDLAIRRLLLPQNDIHAMPPARLRTLSAQARGRAIEALQR